MRNRLRTLTTEVTPITLLLVAVALSWLVHMDLVSAKGTHRGNAVKIASSATNSILVPVTADTYIASEQPDTNFGERRNVFVGNSRSFGTEMTLLRFNTTSPLEAAAAQSASVHLWTQYAELSAMSVAVHRVVAPWDENTITQRSALDRATFFGSSPGRSFQLLSMRNQQFSFELPTEWVTTWLRTPGSNLDIALEYTGSTLAEYSFCSKDAVGSPESPDCTLERVARLELELIPQPTPTVPSPTPVPTATSQPPIVLKVERLNASSPVPVEYRASIGLYVEPGTPVPVPVSGLRLKSSVHGGGCIIAMSGTPVDCAQVATSVVPEISIQNTHQVVIQVAPWTARPGPVMTSTPTLTISVTATPTITPTLAATEETPVPGTTEAPLATPTASETPSATTTVSTPQVPSATPPIKPGDKDLTGRLLAAPDVRIAPAGWPALTVKGWISGWPDIENRQLPVTSMQAELVFRRINVPSSTWLSVSAETGNAYLLAPPALPTQRAATPTPQWQQQLYANISPFDLGDYQYLLRLRRTGQSAVVYAGLSGTYSESDLEQGDVPENAFGHFSVVATATPTASATKTPTRTATSSGSTKTPLSTPPTPTPAPTATATFAFSLRLGETDVDIGVKSQFNQGAVWRGKPLMAVAQNMPVGAAERPARLHGQMLLWRKDLSSWPAGQPTPTPVILDSGWIDPKTGRIPTPAAFINEPVLRVAPGEYQVTYRISDDGQSWRYLQYGSGDVITSGLATIPFDLLERTAQLTVVDAAAHTDQSNVLSSQSNVLSRILLDPMFSLLDRGDAALEMSRQQHLSPARMSQADDPEQPIIAVDFILERCVADPDLSTEETCTPLASSWQWWVPPVRTLFLPNVRRLK